MQLFLSNMQMLPGGSKEVNSVAVQKPELRETEGAAGDERVPGPHRLPDELRPVMCR